MSNRLFDSLSIRGKMLIAFLAMMIGLEVLSTALIIAADIRNMRQEMANTAIMDARLIAEYSITPIMFNDTQGGQSILEKVRTLPDIQSACIYDTLQRAFACHGLPIDAGMFDSIEDPGAARYSFGPGKLLVSAPIQFDNKVYGYVRLVLSTRTMREKIGEHIWVIGLIALLMSAVAVYLAARFQRIFTEPIVHLSDLTQKISREADFSVRLPTQRTDEIGILYRDFDGLLMRIRERQEERDKAEAALRSSEKHMQAILDALPDLIFVFDSQGTFLRFTGSRENLLALPQTFVGRTVSDILPPDVARQTQEHIDKALASGSIQIFEYRLFMHAEMRYYESRMAQSGKNEVLAIVRDITDRRKAEAQLIQAQKMETVGGLASGLAHDFNNVLGAISATVSLMNLTLETDGEIPNDDLRESIDTIKMATQRAAEMVRQLLAFSRRQEITFVPVDLNGTLYNARLITRNSFDKSIVLDFKQSSGAAMVHGDATQMEQVLLNLCVNAEHAMTFMRAPHELQGGTISVSIVREKATPSFVAAHPQASPGTVYWCLRVEDTGVGMDQPTLQRIFDPFYSSKERLRGTGLGLTIVYNIVNHHGGFIAVYSEPGHGSAFHVFIPQAPEFAAVSDALPQVPVSVAGPATILLIDDEEIIRRTVVRLLETFGYEAIAAENGPAGIEMYRQECERIDLVLLDLSMPLMSGREVYAELRKINPGVKVIMSSGLGTDSRVADSLAAGVAGFVEKPYCVEDLVREIERVLGDRAAL